MWLSFLLPVLLGQLQLCAALQRVELMSDGSLEPRQILGGSNCSYTDTCSECFGPGQVICQYIGCFDPSNHEQCCGDASYCVAANNSCCGQVGPGETGTDGVPSATAPIPLPFVSGTTFDCTSSDSGEECCQRGGPNLHWCSGSFPDQFCYNPNSQFCCGNGVVCEYDGCCALISQATVTSPWTAAAASATTPPTTTGSQAGSGSVTPPPSLAGSSASMSATTTTKSTNVAPNQLHSWDVLAAGGAAALAIAGIIFV